VPHSFSGGAYLQSHSQEIDGQLQSLSTGRRDSCCIVSACATAPLVHVTAMRDEDSCILLCCNTDQSSSSSCNSPLLTAVQHCCMAHGKVCLIVKTAVTHQVL
jgi:hypothetical protein